MQQIVPVLGADTPETAAVGSVATEGGGSLVAGGHGTYQPESIELRNLDRYDEGLVGHPVARDAAGRALAVVDRTNNVMEQSLGVPHPHLSTIIPSSE